MPTTYYCSDSTDGTWSTTGNYFRTDFQRFGSEYGTNDNAFVLFTGVEIPQGSIIDGATVRFRCSESSPLLTGSALIHFAYQDNAPALSSVSDADTRPLTAGVSWPMSAWNSGQYYSSPELKTILQSVVDRVGWGESNLLLIVKRNTVDYKAKFYGGQSELIVTWRSSETEELEDLRLNLGAYYQGYDDLVVLLGSYGSHLANLPLSLGSTGQEYSDLRLKLFAGSYSVDDLKFCLGATEPEVLYDIGLTLGASNGTILQNLRLNLGAIRSVVAIRTNIAQRTTSVISEV
jgi:hypothetical protein